MSARERLNRQRGATEFIRRMSSAQRVRFDLRLDRKTFAERYHFPMITLLAWERHETVPDAVAAAFLDAIAADPEGVAKALVTSKAAREAEWMG